MYYPRAIGRTGRFQHPIRYEATRKRPAICNGWNSYGDTECLESDHSMPNSTSPKTNFPPYLSIYLPASFSFSPPPFPSPSLSTSLSLCLRASVFQKAPHTISPLPEIHQRANIRWTPMLLFKGCTTQRNNPPLDMATLKRKSKCTQDHRFPTVLQPHFCSLSCSEAFCVLIPMRKTPFSTVRDLREMQVDASSD